MYKEETSIQSIYSSVQRSSWRIQHGNHDEDASSGSVSLFLAVPLSGYAGGERVGAGDESEMLGEFASCHAGMAGLPGSVIGVDGVLEVVDPRLRSKAFRDFNSWCRSCNDWF